MKIKTKPIDSSACIKACDSCADACDDFVTSCHDDNHADITELRNEAVDLAIMCRYVAGIVARDATAAARLCALCAKLCTAYGNQCVGHQNYWCQTCAAACFRCAQDCREMIYVLVVEHGMLLPLSRRSHKVPNSFSLAGA